MMNVGVCVLIFLLTFACDLMKFLVSYQWMVDSVIKVLKYLSGFFTTLQLWGGKRVEV